MAQIAFWCQLVTFAMKRERSPTPEEFNKLLAWLNSDLEEAGRIFNRIHSRLITVFASRGCVDAEYLADEVVNRVAVRIDKVMTTYSDPLRCCLGFVEFVYQEYQREEQKRLTINELQRRSTEELEREDQCLTQCLDSLPKPERYLVVHYFQGEKRARINRRKQLAVELALTSNALRLRAYKLRKEMHQCIERCLNQS
jgi:hypothetical protein